MESDLSLISQEKWNRIEELATFLKPFAAVTKYMSGSTYPTVAELFRFLTDYVIIWRIQLQNILWIRYRNNGYSFGIRSISEINLYYSIGNAISRRKSTRKTAQIL